MSRCLTVLDVPATLASRLRVLGAGRSDKNDPNDAWSVAIAALRARRYARSLPLITPRCCRRHFRGTHGVRGVRACPGRRTSPTASGSYGPVRPPGL